MSEKQQILNYVIETNKYSYIEISHRIHERPELGDEEIFASRTLIDGLLKSMILKLKPRLLGMQLGL